MTGGEQCIAEVEHKIHLVQMQYEAGAISERTYKEKDRTLTQLAKVLGDIESTYQRSIFRSTPLRGGKPKDSR